MTKRASPSKSLHSHHPDAALDMISACVILCVAVQVCLSCTGGVFTFMVDQIFLFFACIPSDEDVEDCI